MLDHIQNILDSGLAAIGAAGDADGLARCKAAYLGARGELKDAANRLRDVPKQDKPAVGKRLNEVKRAIQAAYDERAAAIGAGDNTTGPVVDLTEPGIEPSVGRRHVIGRVTEDLCRVFARMGFETVWGPELEDDDHNFIKLNIADDHPAREPIDNFYVDDPAAGEKPRMLRSQTSTVQVRMMEARNPPLRIVAPGRVYRPDTVDATHSFMFHQIEGLCVDRGVSMADLKATLVQFARAYFGTDAEIRLRPSYFPFTEPSAELDMKIALRPGDEPKWIELGGCGMVDPAVFEAVGYDPEVWTGFAFGFGIERLVMGKHGVPDIRLLYENDPRFLRSV